MDKNNIIGIIGIVVRIIVLCVILGILFALPTMLLWNACLVPAVAGIHTIGLFQAWGINVLFPFLFKSTTFNTK